MKDMLVAYKDLTEAEDTTVEQWMQFYRDYPVCSANIIAGQLTALANLYYDGNVATAALAEISWQMGGWSGGMTRNATVAEEMLAMAKKEHGEDWHDKADE